MANTLNITDHLEMIPIDAIEINPSSSRQFFDEKSLDTLKHSISQIGLIQPIIVTQQSSGKYTLISGERRYRSMISLNYKEIPAIIKKCDMSEINDISFFDNIMRDELNPIEKSDALLRFKKQHADKTDEELAQILGMSKATFCDLQSLQRLNENIKSRIRQSNAYALRDLRIIAQKKNIHKQAELFDDLEKRIQKKDEANAEKENNIILDENGQLIITKSKNKITDRKSKKNYLDSTLHTINKFTNFIERLIKNNRKIFQSIDDIDKAEDAVLTLYRQVHILINNMDNIKFIFSTENSVFDISFDDIPEVIPMNLCNSKINTIDTEFNVNRIY